MTAAPSSRVGSSLIVADVAPVGRRDFHTRDRPTKILPLKKVPVVMTAAFVSSSPCGCLDRTDLFVIEQDVLGRGLDDTQIRIV